MPKLGSLTKALIILPNARGDTCPRLLLTYSTHTEETGCQCCPVADRSKTCSNVIYHLNLIERSKCKQSCNSGRWLRLSAPANYLVPRRACSYGAWYILW
ncbi:hypothetical protein BGW80DRAFT_1261651 [Lactifluus volemus]|nr:hypothetical protein BGW80DRAFT_1261651 [Lactifluus volemus]